MKISVLIPYKPDHDRRDFLWKYVKRRYQRLFPELDICIGRDKSKIFNRSKAINRAAKKAKGDIFIITDADVVFNEKLISEIAANIHKHPWIIPFKNGYRLTKKATDKLIGNGLKGKIQIDPGDIERIEGGLGALMNVVTRSCFRKVRGFDERFKGWGPEDKAFYESLETICGHHFRMDQDIYHLWHAPAEIVKSESLKHQALYQKYLNATNNKKAMQKLINERDKV